MLYFTKLHIDGNQALKSKKKWAKRVNDAISKLN